MISDNHVLESINHRSGLPGDLLAAGAADDFKLTQQFQILHRGHIIGQQQYLKRKCYILSFYLEGFQ